VCFYQRRNYYQLARSFSCANKVCGLTFTVTSHDAEYLDWDWVNIAEIFRVDLVGITKTHIES